VIDESAPPEAHVGGELVPAWHLAVQATAPGEPQERRHSKPAPIEIRTWDRLRTAITMGEKVRRGLGIEPNRDRFVAATAA
jgi:hypothetical protein